jgi:hypothetical protein
MYRTPIRHAPRPAACANALDSGNGVAEDRTMANLPFVFYFCETHNGWIEAAFVRFGLLYTPKN